MTSLCDKLMCLGKRQDLESKKAKLMSWLTNIALVDFVLVYANLFHASVDGTDARHVARTLSLEGEWKDLSEFAISLGQKKS